MGRVVSISSFAVEGKDGSAVGVVTTFSCDTGAKVVEDSVCSAKVTEVEKSSVVWLVRTELSVIVVPPCSPVVSLMKKSAVVPSDGILTVVADCSVGDDISVVEVIMAIVSAGLLSSVTN